MGYIQHTKRLLRERLERTHYVDSFTIQKDAQTVFCLFFFTKHIRGFEKMLEAKWRFNGETGQGWHYSAGTGVGDLFDKPTPQTQILERALEILIGDGRPVTNAEIYRETLEQGFLPKHSNEILTGKNLAITAALVCACLDTWLSVNRPPPAKAIGSII